MQLDEVVHARGRLARELEQIVGHAIVATLLVEFGHYREVLDDVRRYVGRQKLLAPRGHPHVATADRPAVVFARLFGSGFAGLGIHPYVHPGRTRCMRHCLPHARRIGRGMLLLLFPLRAFGHGRTGDRKSVV